jgi:hypothetical protein
MARISYEIVAFEADRLIVRMALAPSLQLMDFYWGAYLNLLHSSGWTDQEFDKETLRRIDEYWQRKLRCN